MHFMTRYHNMTQGGNVLRIDPEDIVSNQKIKLDRLLERQFDILIRHLDEKGKKEWLREKYFRVRSFPAFFSLPSHEQKKRIVNEKRKRITFVWTLLFSLLQSLSLSFLPDDPLVCPFLFAKKGIETLSTTTLH